MSNLIENLEPVQKLTRDVVKAMRGGAPGGITDNEARFLVDAYYTVQGFRIQMNNQIKALVRDAEQEGNEPEPHDVLTWFYRQMSTVENEIKKVMAVYVESHKMGWFFEQTVGIGPILAAGLLAHIDIHKAPTVGHIWNFAGLNPDINWEKGMKRPFNAELKKLCWKIGESFVKVSGKDTAYYGKVYKDRKEFEVSKNEKFEYKDQAEKKLGKFKIGKDTEAYKAYSKGMLPPAHINQRAKRYAVKLFLSHLHQRWHETEIGPVPKPYAVAQLGHAHVITPPQIKP